MYNNNLKLLRMQSGLQAKELAKLLNVTVHTYTAFEQNRMTIPEVSVVMLGKIYSLPPTSIIGEPLDKNDIQKLFELKVLTEKKRWETVVLRLFGDNIHVSYRKVSILKEELLRNSNEKIENGDIDKRKSC